jgi:hypothetical protein
MTALFRAEALPILEVVLPFSTVAHAFPVRSGLGLFARVRSTFCALRHFPLLHCLLAMFSLAAFAQAQTFDKVPSLSFVKPYAGANPLPQVLTIAASSSIQYSITATTSSGGSWLTLSNSGCCLSTPSSVIVTAAPAVSLAAGTYTGTITVTQSSGPASMTIPVTLVIEASGKAFFDNLPGQLSFSLQTSGAAPPAQQLSIRNGGSGSLSWTASSSTSDGGKWLTLSATSGTAPSTVSATITPSALPGGGATAGTYVGEIILQSSSGNVSIPVSVTVGQSVFRQVNGLSFDKPFAGEDPLPQTISISSTDEAIQSEALVYTANGGNWLSISFAQNYRNTPYSEVVSVTPDPSLAAGTYTGQIVVRTSPNAMAMTVPVTLTIESTPATSYFDNLPGQVSFSMKTGGATPPAQSFQIRSGGSGAVSWTASSSTSDGGNWLSLSSTSGTTPATVSVAVNKSSLPGGGALSGTYIGQILLRSSSGNVTIPVSFEVGDNVLQQINGLSFNKLFAGPDPLPQTIVLPSTGNPLLIRPSVNTANGGNWLSISAPSNYRNTPVTETVSINADPSLPAGTYTGQIVILTSDDSVSMTVPVTLTIEPSGSTSYLANLAGQLTFSLQTGGSAPPSQPVPIRSGGTSVVNWTASATTSDSGKWLLLGASSGSSPSTLSVSINPSLLPGQGKVIGSYAGQVLIQTASGNVTIPVRVTVGDTVLKQSNPLFFSKTSGSGNPLPQTILLPTTSGSESIIVSAHTATGGNWLSISKTSNYYATPLAETVSVNPDPSLAAGTYTGEVIVTSSDDEFGMTIPVTLSIDDSGTPSIDNVQGQASFFVQTGATANPPTQNIPVRNANSGTLTWSVFSTTSDGGKWITTSSTSSTAPSVLTVGVSLSALPGQGKVSGVYTGQVLLTSSTESVSVPVAVFVGTNQFNQQPAITFSKPTSGSDVSSQTITISATGQPALQFSMTDFSGRGGKWLKVTPSGNVVSTPSTLTLSIDTSIDLPNGSYAGEIIITQSAPLSAMTIPVFYNVGSTLTPTQTTLTSSANPSTPGQSITLTASVTGTGTGLNGNVTFKDGSTTLATVALNSRVATYTTSSLSTGTHSLTAVYAGNSLYSSSTSAVLSQVVNSGGSSPASSSTALTSSLTPSVAGESVRFVATVTSSASNITGTITFKDGSTTLGTGTITGGTASYSTTALTAGTHSITAVYGGDSAHSGSTSAAVSQSVLVATTLKLTSSANPGTSGQFLTLTATITTSGSSPSGYVTIFDGSTAISTVAVSGKTATLRTSALAKGTHSLSAVYGGSGSYAGSSSAALSETVN